jgi:hypothetical protein
MAYASALADLVVATLDELGPYNAVQQICQKYQDYDVLGRWFKNLQLGTGVAIKRQLMVGDGSSNGPAAHVPFTQEDTVNIPDILKNIVIEWVHAKTSWAVVRQEVLMNSGKEAILDYIQSQRNYAMLQLFTEMEEKAWGTAPTSSNTTDPWGIQYWLVQNATTGFKGGSPTGDNRIAGLNLSTLPGAGEQFNNYTFTYAAATPSDLMTKMRTAYRAIRWRSPVSMKQYDDGPSTNYVVYCNETSMGAFEEIAAAQGDTGITDVSPVDGGDVVFKKHPIIHQWVLDQYANNPIYMVNHNSFKPRVLKGDNMEESMQMVGNLHNVVSHFVDLTYNYENTNRRSNAVAYQA